MSCIEKAWRTRNLSSCLLWPVSVLYGIITGARRFAYDKGWFATTSVSLPVVVVGNISIGGTGKSPLCSYLVEHFKAMGWHPAIVSRGYGGMRHETPILVSSNDTAARVGDEPLMLQQMSGVPVCVCTKRALAVNYLAQHTDTDIVFADDGLQHLAMPRVAELVVLDAQRGLGNGWLLPAGPLRERASRLSSAQIIAVQGEGELHESLKRLSVKHESLHNHRFGLSLFEAVSLHDGHRQPLSFFKGTQVTAMAGIGHPPRFFDALRAEGLNVQGIAKPDHHSYSLHELGSELEGTSPPLLVTSKDAVKLRSLGPLPRAVYEITCTVEPSEPLRESIHRLEQSLRDQFL